MASDLKNILTKVQDSSRTGNRRELSSTLRQLLGNRREYYRQSVEEELLDDFADALYKILLLELDEEEEDSIEIAELAYLGIGTVLQQGDTPSPELYKRRLLLLHYFCDYFTDSVIEIFLKKYRADNLLQARNLAIECLEKMQLSDMFYLEEDEPDFINRDEQLADACNTIETDVNLSEEERQGARLLHKVMYAYLKTKYKELSNNQKL